MKTSFRQQKRKYNRKVIVLAALLFISLLPFITTFSRYAINSVNEFFNRSKEFYFYSDKLDINGTHFMIDNWSGVDDYPIQINMNSRKNNILSATYDIDYDISVNHSNNIICNVSKNSGTISRNTNTDFFIVTVIPNERLNTGDEVSVDISAYASEPYEKEITGEFVLRVGIENITYVIEDEDNSPYCEVKITNTQSYYTVDTAFGDYSAGQKITIDEYLSLSEVNKAKCHSAIIKLEFNPRMITLDMTNSNYINAMTTSSTSVNGYNYVSMLQFKLDAISSTSVRFYKRIIPANYTYPSPNNSIPIVNFSTINPGGIK